MLLAGLESGLRIAAAAIRLSQRLRGSDIGLALVYHRVATGAGDPGRELLPALATGDFAAQVEHLRRHYRPVTAGELVSAARVRRRGQPLPVAVTFDDDLASHARVVAPVLRSVRVPATFFLTGASLSDPQAFWWQYLQQAADQQRLDPLELPGVPHEARGLHAVAGAVERMSPERRDAVTRALGAKVDGAQLDPGLRAGQVAQLARDGFEIGFHTREHHPLPTLDDERLRTALRDGHAALEAAAAGPVKSLAYPHGACDARTGPAAREAGFACAFTTSGEPLRGGSDPWRVGRFEPRSRSLGVFSLKLAIAPLRSAPVAPGDTR